MKQKIKTHFKNKHLSAMIFFVVLGLVSLWINFYPQNQEMQHSREPTESVDTFIPKGYVLIPLDLINLESVNSFIGDAGVVDLYQAKQGNRGMRVASRVKIIRAPLNPQLFAALVPENSSTDLLRLNEELFAVVQNKSENSGKIESQKLSRKKIIYQK